MKKKVIGLIVTVIVISSILGISYSYLKAENPGGNQELGLTNFGVIISEDMKELILNNEIPKKDELGLQNEARIFKIKNEGSITAKYKVSLIDKELSTMKNEDARYQLKRTSNKDGESKTFEITNLASDGVIDEGVIAPDEEISYEIVIWIDYNSNPNGLKFSKVISLEASQVPSLDTSGANPPEMLSNMIPVYYDKISETEGVWRKADPTNLDPDYKWFDYNDYMWANAVTVKDTTKKKSDITGNNVLEPLYTYTKLDNGDIYFDGVDDFYDLGHANENLGNTISIVARFKVDSFLGNNSPHIIANPENAGVYLKIFPNKYIQFGIHTGGSDYNNFSSEKPIEEDTWYTVVATYDGSKVQIYVYQDGKLASKNEKTLTGNIKTSIVPFILGANPTLNGIPTDSFLNGTINSALVYTDVLTDEEITNNFTNEITTYPTDNLLIEAKDFSEPTDWHSKYTKNEDGSLSFDGVDDFYYLGQENYNFKNSISIAARFKINKFPSSGAGYIIGNAEASGIYFQVSSIKKLEIGIHNGSNYNLITSSKTLTEGKWYTAIATYDGNKMQLYIYQDGKLLSKDEKSLTGNIKISSVPLMLGADPSPWGGFPYGSFLNGSISSAFIYTDVLTESEIENYFAKEIVAYPKDHLLIGYDNFKEKSAREVYLNANPGIEVKMDEITSMWVWIPRYKYTIFNGNNGTAEEQMVNVQFEHGIDTTGTVKCVDKILTDDDSASSEECTDETNKSIINGKSTYTHPAFTFGDEELVGFWMSKFESSTDDNACLTNQSTNCNKKGMNIYIKPDQISLRYINLSNIFANARSMELYNNIHGFPQSEEATSYLDTNGNLSGEIPNDNNNYDIHLQKNMEWGAVAYLTMSKYGKYGNNLYKGEYKEVYKNNYQEINNSIYTLKTGYSGKIPTADVDVNGVLYNNLTIEQEGQGYIGAGASTTGTVYGIYDMAGGSYEFVMANMVNTDGNFVKYGWQDDSLNEKYYDKYSFNITNGTEASRKRGKLGDATREVQKQFDILNSRWYNGTAYLQHDSKNGVRGTWLGRGTSDYSHAGIFSSGQLSGGQWYSLTSRPVLTITREFQWLNNKN